MVVHSSFPHFVDPGFGEKVLQHAAAFEGAMQRRGVPAVVRRHLVRGEMLKNHNMFLHVRKNHLQWRFSDCVLLQVFGTETRIAVCEP